MRRRLAIVVSACALALVMGASPASAHPATAGHHFAAGIVRLDGSQEVPPADPDGRGTFAYVAFDSTLCYVLTARDIEPATMAHIHAGARGVAGPVVIALTAPTDGLSADCIHAVADGSTTDGPTVLLQSELDAIIAGPSGFYANVHNTPYPNGAIRGQLR